MGQSFDEVVTSRERLRELNRHPSHLVSKKEIDHLDDICRRFIAASPFVVITSRGLDDRLDVSPKGDPAGFVAVLDDKNLAIRTGSATTGWIRLKTCWSAPTWV